MSRLQGKVAVITGAGSGMGRSAALLFAAEGAMVVCADRSGQEKEVADEIGPAAVAVNTDVSVEADVQRMVATAETEFGRLDVLFNNAGFGGPRMPLHEQTLENWELVHDTNLKGVFLGMKYGIASMLNTGGGSVISTASAVGLVGFRNHSIYGAAKAGVIQLTKAAALDYAESNIRVNAICPGLVWTNLVGAAREAGSMGDGPPKGSYPTAAPVPMKRWGLAAEIANAALFLASDESSFITGVALPVDGGFVCP
jgi:NAD(P)-dependent dehydrogenase (short-subunit alcohol dehydrogenase family)